MNETLLYQLFEYIAVIFETLIIYQYTEGFSQKRVSNRRTLFGYAVFGVGLMTLNVFWSYPLALIIYCGMGILALEFFLYKSSVLQKLFSASLFVAIVIVSEIISAGIITFIASIDFSMVEKYGMPRVISIVVSKLVLILMVKLTGSLIKSNRDQSSPREVKQALPLFLCQIFSIILAYYIFVLSMKVYVDFSITIFLSMLGILYMNFLMFWYFDRIELIFDLKAQNEAAEETLKLQTHYYTQIEERINETLAVRHDMKRHFAMAKLMYKDNQIPAEYIAELEMQFERQTPIIQTPHPLISTLLTDEKRKAMEADIDFRTNVTLIADIKVNSVDLCVMLGNILDNAIEACAGLPAGTDKYIVVEIMQRNSKLLIYVENPYNIHLVKPRRAYHGFGLKNVEKVVDKYGGLIDRNSENGLYKVRIIIP